MGRTKLVGGPHAVRGPRVDSTALYEYIRVFYYINMYNIVQCTLYECR